MFFIFVLTNKLGESINRFVSWDKQQLAVKSSRSSYYLISVLPVTTDCSSSQFTCDSGLCIDKTKACDGHVDCNDWTDETTCSKYSFVIVNKPWP